MAKILLSDLQKKVLPHSQIKENLLENENFQAFVKQKREEFTDLSIIYDNFFDEGIDQTIYYCHKCGHNWREKDRKSYNNYYGYNYYGRYNREPSKLICPCCGKESQVHKESSTVAKIGSYAFVRECNNDDGYALIDILEFEIYHSNASIPEKRKYDGENIDYLIGEFIVRVSKAREGLVSTTYGIRPPAITNTYYGDGNGELLSANACDFESSKKELKEAVYIPSKEDSKLKELLSESTEKTINEILVNLDTALQEKKSKKPKVKKVDDLDSLIDSVKFEEISLDLALERIKDNPAAKTSSNPINSIMYSQLGGVKKYANACNCGHVFDVELPEQGYSHPIVCPKCGNQGNSSHSHKSQSCGEKLEIMKYELMPDGTGIVVRIFEIAKTFYLEGRKVEHTITEKHRFFFMEKSVKVLNYQGKNWVKGRVTDLDDYGRYYHKTLFMYNTKEELLEIIKNSVFKYSGLIEALGLVNKTLQIDELGTISRNSYMYAWTKYKCIEQLLKTGMKSIVRSIINDHTILDKYNKNGTTVYDILGITKPVYMMAKTKDVSPSDLGLMKKLWTLEESLNLELYEQIVELRRTDLVVTIKEKFNIPFKKTIEYINSCYDHQCIERQEAMTIWYDYLRMAKDMDYRLKDNTIKYPSSLKKDHDRATFAYKVVQDEMNQKRFIENANVNMKLYEYASGDFIIKVPMHPNEVVQEGNVQKHCVASYVNRIRDGETAVCFARKKDDPETAYFTIEVKDSVVVQVKGYCNCAPKDPDFLEFLQKWAEKKKLKLRY